MKAVLFALATCLAIPPAARALSVDEVVQATLRPGWRMASGAHMAAIVIRLADHWHTYWRAPGDAGVPPQFDWSGSANLAAVTFHWPRPEVFDLGGVRTVGYEHLLVLPIEFKPKAVGEPISVKVRMEIGVCNDICVPVQFDLSARLAGPGADVPAIRAALAEEPLPADEAGVSSVTCTVKPIKDGLHLTAKIRVPRLGPSELALFETSDPAIWIGSTSTDREGGTLVAGADLVPAEAAPFVLDRSQLRITLIGAGKAVNVDGCPAG